MPEKPPSRSLFFRSPPIMFLTLLTALMGLFVVILLSTFRLSSPAQRQNIKKPEAATQALISLPKASTWSDEEQVTSSYMPTTPLVADVSSSYPNKEVSYINSDGKLVIYAASGGNPIVTTGVVAGGMFGIDSSEFAPSAIKLDSDNYYEILVPGRVGTTWEGTLKAFRGDGSAISGLNTSFVEGIPLSAPLVDDLDADGNPEIILPVYHNANATTRLLGWTWNGSQLTGLNSGNKVLITVSGSGGFVPRFTAPASGNITSTSSSSKEVAAAVENPDGTMSIYVFRKNGSATVQVPTSGSWYQEAINEPVPGTSSNGTNPGIGGIAMVDLGGDAKQEIVIVTHKQVPSNPWGGYVVRVFNHNSSQGSGQTFATKLQTNIVNSIYLPSSRPAIGFFQGQSKAIVFNTVYNSGGTNTNGRALFAAYYNGSNLQWINGYSPRTITYKDSSPCNIKLETGLSSVTLGDGNNNGANEAFYSKFFTYISPSYYYTLYFYNAEGAPTDDPNCTQALDHYDASSFTNAQNPGGINLRIESMSNLELADIDGDGLLEMATTYSYPSGVNRYNRLYVYDLSGPASSAQDSPMAGGNECRQGRYRGSCPFALGGSTATPAPPTLTPTRTPTPTPTPSSCPYYCTDTDGGKNYTVNGLINTNWGGWIPNSPDKCGVLVAPGNYQHQTTCSGSNCYLLEYYCLANSCNSSPQIDILRCNQCGSGACSSLGSPLGVYSYYCNYNMSNNVPNPPDPGRIEAENFTCGGQNVAYYDTSSANEGNVYRTNERVDIQGASDVGGGNNIGWTRAGEWIKYEMNVSTSGYYKFTFRVASANNTGKFQLLLDGKVISGTNAVSVPNTGGNQNWTDISVSSLSNVLLSAGHHTLQLNIVGGYANYNYITVARSSSTVTNTPTPIPSTSCLKSSQVWKNSSFSPKSGIFTVEFDATPGGGYIDAMVGLSFGSASKYANVAAFARFKSNGYIDARNYDQFQAQNSIRYYKDISYHFRLVVDFPNKSYSIYVRPAGASEKTVGTNYRFRNDWTGGTSLNNLAAYATSGTETVCNLVLK